MAAMKYVVTVQQDGGQDVTCRGDNELWESLFAGAV
jgi:hypothetical protein